MSIAAFTRHQRLRNLSPTTIRRRNVSLRLFAAHIAPNPLLEATGEHIERWLGTYPAPATRRAYRSDLQAFFTWATRRDLISVNPVLRTDSIRVPKPLPRPVPAAYLPMILAAAQPDVRLMIALAAYAGLRVAEIAALDVGDVDLVAESPLLAVRCGKGSKDRTVPLHPDLVALLRQGMPRSGPVVAVTALTVGRKISEHMRSLGVEATAHKLRASFGTELARTSRGNVVLVASLMGHSDVSTTMRYIGWSGGQGADTVSAMFPTARSSGQRFHRRRGDRAAA